MQGPYLGHPYFVSGHALFNAIARRVDERVRRALQVSTGVFVPGIYGSYPGWHSRSGGVPYLGTQLRPVESYADLFLFRDAVQRWVSGSRPRDAQNTFDVQEYGGRRAFAPEVRFGLPAAHRYSKRTVTWYVQCYLHAAGAEDVIPLSEDVLDGLRVGGARNYGFGGLAVKDTQTVDVESLDFACLEAAQASGEGFQLELVSPYVLRSEFPGADDQDVPWWWDVDAADTGAVEDAGQNRPGGGLRRRESRLAMGDEVHELEVVDHGQIVDYAGSDPIETAINGILRVGTHAKYGFGEFRVWPRSANRVPERSSGASMRGGDV
jgi:hypothetical protein